MTDPTTAAPPAHVRPARTGGDRRVAWVLALLVLVSTMPVVQYLLDQQQSRIALTAAVWDHHTLRLDAYTDVLGVDRAEREGHTYSDKAPGQPMLGVPFYGLYRVVGGEPATVPRQRGNLGVWWVSVWCAAVPAAILAVLMRVRAAEVAPRRATAAAVAVAFGTLLLPFATLLFSHVLSGLLGYAAYSVADRPAPSARRLAGAGALAGAAVLTEYTLGLLVAVLLVWVLLRHRWGVVWFALGGVPAAVLLMLYNHAVFGGPLTFSYQAAAHFGDAHARGLVGVQVPRLGMLAEVLAGGRGLFTLTPVVLAGVVGLVALWRRGGRERELGSVGLAVFVGFVALQSGWSNAYGGASPGPRYVVPALPFLAVGVAAAFDRWPRVTTATAAVGAAAMALATYTHPLVARREIMAIDNWALRAWRGEWIPTVLTPVVGHWGLVLVLIAAAAAAVALRRADARTGPF